MKNDKNTIIRYKSVLYGLLVSVEEPNKQQQVIELLQNYEAKIPDSRFKDGFQKMMRKNMTYDELCDSYVTDLFDKKIDDRTRVVLADLLIELKKVVADEPKNWWDVFIGWFKKSTGTK